MGTPISAHVSVNLKLFSKIKSINFSKNTVRALRNLHQMQRKKCQVGVDCPWGRCGFSVPARWPPARVSQAFLLAMGCHSTEPGHVVPSHDTLERIPA